MWEIKIASYGSKKTEKCCTDPREAQKVLGKQVAEKLRILMAWLEETETLYEVACIPRYRAHELKGNYEGYYGLDIAGISKAYRLIIKPIDVVVEKDDDFLKKCKKIKIIHIEEVSKHYE